MRSPVTVLLLLMMLVAAGLLFRFATVERATPEPFTVAGILGPGDDDAQFARADRPGAIRLPEHHGPRPEYRNEWWYFVGNLADDAGREYGFQLTFFRFALMSGVVEGASRWRSRDIYMAHFAITDVARGTHRATERLVRPVFGLAGARAEPFAVWLEDWQARSLGDAFLPLELAATDRDTGIGLTLQLDPGRGPILNGEAGLSAKGPEPGNASYYYSFTRMPVHGVVRIDGRASTVRGTGWFDREWGTSALGRGVVGWDWFALQLDDGRDLMIYGLRDEQGNWREQSAGTLVHADGGFTPLRREDFRVRAGRRWQSPDTGARYPVEWHIEVPAHELSVRVRAALDAQEQDLSVRYWEGFVYALDEAGTRIGRGYMELVGY